MPVSKFRDKREKKLIFATKKFFTSECNSGDKARFQGYFELMDTMFLINQLLIAMKTATGCAKSDSRKSTTVFPRSVVSNRDI